MEVYSVVRRGVKGISEGRSRERKEEGAILRA
jgi:hypothetical protein